MFPDWQYVTICISESCQQAELIPLLVLGPEMKLDIYLIETDHKTLFKYHIYSTRSIMLT